MECFGAGGSGSVGWVLINAVRAVPVTTTLLLCSGLAPWARQLRACTHRLRGKVRGLRLWCRLRLGKGVWGEPGSGAGAPAGCGAAPRIRDFSNIRSLFQAKFSSISSSPGCWYI